MNAPHVGPPNPAPKPATKSPTSPTVDAIAKAPGGSSHVTLLSVGLNPQEPVRFRPLGAHRWVIGKVSRVEPDGSITLRDPEGAARSFRADSIQVRRPGHRGRLVWRVVSDVAVTWEQLELFGSTPSSL